MVTFKSVHAVDIQYV